MTLHRSLLLAAALATGMAGCASTPEPQAAGKGSDAVSQPLRDLSLIRDVTPEALTRSAAGPYATETVSDCAALSTEIAALDLALGPDLDGPQAKGDGIVSEAADAALRSVFDLPFRGVIRRVSGADKRDKAHARAVLAGMVRRGFLKGLAVARRCPPPPAAAAPTAGP
ncbi:MAG TPA: hypothetical protein PLF78_02415 [Caulobacter sp.]|nr:hypothetical protein [Caulobacter sp.]